MQLHRINHKLKKLLIKNRTEISHRYLNILKFTYTEIFGRKHFLRILVNMFLVHRVPTIVHLFGHDLKKKIICNMHKLLTN